MSNEIIKFSEQPSAIQRFGDDQTLQWLMERGAEIFQVAREDLKYSDVKGALTKAMQLTLSYGAMPGKHVYLIPFGKRDGDGWRNTYAVADSYEWRKASADRKAAEMRQQYMVQVETMSAEETRKCSEGIGGPYDASDVGAKARVLFMHELTICKQMGIEYSPPWHYGFWKKNAVEKGGKWQPDNVPAGRTRTWQAQKRAEKSALAQHFELLPIADWQNRTPDQRRAAIEDHLVQIEPSHELPPMMTYQNEPLREEDGDCLFATETPRPTTQRAPEPAPEPAPTVVVAETAPAQPNPTKWASDEAACQAAIKAADVLADKPGALVAYMRQAHQAGVKSEYRLSTVGEKNGKSNGGQYGLLIWKLESRYGDDSHRPILSALCGEIITRDNPPGVAKNGRITGANELIDWLSKPEENRQKLAILDEVVVAIERGNHENNM